MSDSVADQEDQDRRFLKVCSLLNEQGARYFVIGGYACILHGALRATEDVDLLIEDSPDNFRRVIAALSKLEDGIARELTEQDLADNLVIKISDEIMIDVSKRAWTVTYDEAAPNGREEIVNEIRIPYLGLKDLIRSKQTYRAKDRLDLQLLIENSPEARELMSADLAGNSGCLGKMRNLWKSLAGG
ncbi:MAG: hypothetical protein ACR2OZ_10475 [Verrucomicrobiales bacterium]